MSLFEAVANVEYGEDDEGLFGRRIDLDGRYRRRLSLIRWTMVLTMLGEIGLTKDFASGATPEDVCAQTIRSLRAAGVQHEHDDVGLGDGLLAALVGVVLDVARRAVGGHGQRLAAPMDADDAGVGARGAVLKGVGHDVAVVLLPDPALGGHVGAGDDLDHRIHPAFGGGHVGGGAHRGRGDPGPLGA